MQEHQFLEPLHFVCVNWKLSICSSMARVGYVGEKANTQFNKNKK